MKNIIHLAIACALSTQGFAETVAQSPAVTSVSLFKQGQAAEKAGDAAAAKDFYTKSLKMDPNNANARYSLGQIQINAASISAKAREEKFGSVNVPVYQLDGATLQEALDLLSLAIEKESKNTVTPNFIIQDPKLLLADRKITLNLKGMPSKAVMKYVMDQAGAKARYDEHAVVIVPR